MLQGIRNKEVNTLIFTEREREREQHGYFVGNRRNQNAEAHDYYATEPKATEVLLEQEHFAPVVWECACGEGHISKVLESHGYNVVSTDLVYRGYGRLNPCDFLLEDVVDFSGDIITNPPYKYALEFVKHALNIVQQGRKVAMFLKLTFLEGKARKAFFLKNPPKVVYVSSSRLECGKNGKFERKNAVAYAWFVWEKGFCGDPIIKWVN